MKYAIKLTLAVDDYIYITEDTGNCWDLQVRTFNSKLNALDVATIWGSKAKVVQYSEEIDGR
jgi:hypothetical protein